MFTKSSHVKLELNGRTVGEKDLTPSDKYIAVFEVPYQPGELKATVYENGQVSATRVLKSAGEPSGIKVTADRTSIKADPNDLSFLKIEVVDASGQIVPGDSTMISLAVEGPGILAASGNADPKDMASVNNTQVKTWKGRAQVVIRPVSAGTVRLKAELPGLATGEVTIDVTGN